LISTYKGILLAGGHGTRLYPVTKGISKQLLPVYDKPMIYYPLSVLMLAGIKDVLLITDSNYLKNYQNLLGDGEKLGINITYEIQKAPAGIAEAFLIGEKFIGDSNVALILGDNIFYGQNFSDQLKKIIEKKSGATVLAHQVKNPSSFGVVDFDKSGKVLSLEEKPKKPKSNYAVTGLYFYDNEVIQIAKSIKPSSRGELEITDINNIYRENGKLEVEILGRGFAWLDTGTHEALIDASLFVQTIEKRQGLKVACIEEIAFNQNWISKKTLLSHCKNHKNTPYGDYLSRFISELK